MTTKQFTFRMPNDLREKLEPFMDTKISSIVLGCTHYPFVIIKILKDYVKVSSEKGE